MSVPGTARRPEWLRIKLRTNEAFAEVRGMMQGLALTTVCEEARCPNIFECWSNRTATFMILGEVCTRRCGFCAVTSGMPSRAPDPNEPRRVADAVRKLGLAHAVITSVDRDDLPDGGAGHFARTIEAVRSVNPGCAVEVLTPDFKGVADALSIVLAARPEVFSHNTETVKRLYRTGRPGSRYEGSLALLRAAADARDAEANPEEGAAADQSEGAIASSVGTRGNSGPAGDAPTRSLGTGTIGLSGSFGEVSVPSFPPYRFRVKTGLMVGLGETDDELRETFRDIRAAGVEVLTLGQYLQPTKEHLPVERYVTPAEFANLREYALSLGFLHVEAGPLVRSSYHAHTHRPEPLPLHQS